MKLNKELISKPPVWNKLIADHFSQFPIFMMNHIMKEHQKKRHIQPGIEITITNKGKASFVVDNEIYTQSSGDIMLLSGHIPHQVFIDPTTRYQRTVICVDDHGLEEVEQIGLFSLFDGDWFSSVDYSYFKLPVEVHLEVKRIALQMNAEIATKSIGWERMALAHLTAISVLLQRSMAKHREVQKKEISTGNTISHLIEASCEYIRHHLHEDLTLQRMAKLLSISQEHLTRMFRQQKGMTYYQYVILQRVLESKRLICEYPNMSLTDIAYTTGFPSSSQFTRLFKSSVGMTPTEFRRQTICRN